MKTEAEPRNHLVSLAAEDESFRGPHLSDPKGAVKNALGIDAPGAITVHVHEETRTDIHLVVPSHDQLSGEELASLSGASGWTRKEVSWRG